MNAFSISPVKLFNLVFALFLAALPARTQTAGTLDSAYDPNASGSVVATAVQPDGKTIIVGSFGTVGGAAHPGIARLLADGTVDAGFTATTNGSVSNVVMQYDGKVLIAGSFTTVNGTSRNRIARLNADGSLESAATFDPGTGANGSINSVAVQADGKILLAGSFTTVNGTTRNRIARLNADGSLESTATFDPGSGADSSVYSVALQDDGKILLGGNFTQVYGTSFYGGIARLNANGSLDASFRVELYFLDYELEPRPASVIALAVQADGKILLSGDFTYVNYDSRNLIARLHPNGTTDTGFNPNANSGIYSMAVQADGKILLGGSFTQLSGTTRNRIARLNADGSLENATTFNSGAGANGIVLSVAAQANGEILVGGTFTQFNGTTRNRIARLNNDAAPDSLTAPDMTQVQWLRGGAAPEIPYVTFDLSTDGGTNWSPLGAASRMSGGWALMGLSLPASGEIRALARTTGGQSNGSSGLVETSLALGGVAPEIAVERPSGADISDGSSESFGPVAVGDSAISTFTIKNTGTARLTLPGVTKNGPNHIMFTVTSTPATLVPGGGTTSFTVRFAPTSAGPKASALHIASNDADESPFDITLTGTGTLSTNANLSALTPSAGTLGPIFASSTTSYTVSVPYSTPSITITPTVAQSTATVAVNGVATISGVPSAPIGLSVGANSISVVVTAGDGVTTKTYTLAITRAGLNANLSALSLSAGTLAPAFASGTISYTASVPFNRLSVTVTPTVEQSSTTIAVNGVAVTSGLPSAPIGLIVGANSVSVVVTAGDGVTTKTYTLTITRAGPVPGNVDPGFAPNRAGVNGGGFTAVVQPDQKIILGGFGAVGGTGHVGSARFNVDGTLNSTFNPNLSGYVSAVMVQEDGKILLGGYFTTLGGIVRLHPNGTLDSSFNLNADNSVNGMAVQADGKVILGGSFTAVGGAARNYVARLDAGGTLETGFNPNANSDVYGVAVQPDGKILLWGAFTSVGGTSRNRIARLHSDGTLDAGFDSDANSSVFSAAVQADGKIIIGGAFTTVGGTQRNDIARLNADGALDSGFDPNANGGVFSVALQADGRVFVVGDFSTVGGTQRESVARLNADGTLDATFIDVAAAADPYSVTLQADGNVVIVGPSVGGDFIVRLLNSPATESFTIPSASRVRWLRAGTSPEATLVTFDLSTDGGVSWSPLGAGVRMGGGWELTGLSLPASGELRARARTAGGFYNGSSGLVETVTTFTLSLPDADGDGLLDAWELAYWPTTAGHGPADDFDHDGLTELQELAFGLNPTLPDCALQPTAMVEGGYLTITLTKHAGATYEVQSAGTLLPGHPNSFSPTTTTVLLNSATTIKVRDNIPYGTPPARFLRVKVIAAP